MSSNNDIESSAQGDEERGLLSLFAGRKKIYPARVAGRYRRLKWLLMALFLSIYYFVPFIRWNRGDFLPHQAVLVDIPGRKFYFFFFEVWPQEVFVFTGLLLLAAFALFFVTSILGRVWCGFACPQTVWTDLYIFVEDLIEGDRNARKRLDAAPWGAEKIAKKTLKHVAWIFIAMATGGAWVMYFTDAPTLLNDLMHFEISFAAGFWICALTASTYLLAGFAREQVCTYMCPYARFQGAMYDENTLLATYEEKRGEPRGKARSAGIGDCVDCNRCVAVCPMGIDIREGQQYQCINCGLCVDACNDVMAKLGRPLGLVRYDTLNNVNTGRRMGFFDIFNFHRPRPLIYGAIISAVGLLLIYSLTMGRSMLDINIIRERNPIYIKLSDGSIRNVYTVHIVNKGHEMLTYEFSATGQEGAKLAVSDGGDEASAEKIKLAVRPDQVGSWRLFVDIPKTMLKPGSSPIAFAVTGGGDSDRYKSVFIAPDAEE